MKIFKSLSSTITVLLILFFVVTPNSSFASDTKIKPLSKELHNAIRGLVAKNRKMIKKSINRIGEIGNSQALPALEALGKRKLKADDATGKVFIINNDDSSGFDIIKGEVVDVSMLDLRTPRINNSVRRSLRSVIALLGLMSAETSVRLSAAENILKKTNKSYQAIVHKALESETDKRIRTLLGLILAKIDINSDDSLKRVEAIKEMGASGSIEFKTILEDLLRKGEDGKTIEKNRPVLEAAKRALDKIERKQFFISLAGNFFYGISLGSVLLLAALGLAITFGMMGVINMAHGEMLMLGAYTTYVVQNIFTTYFPSMFDAYIIVAIPTAFIVTALIGAMLEQTVIRFLYGRPLETLLATWGISLVLIQSVRLWFGAQNVSVMNPSWLSGGITLFEGVVFPYSRFAIIIFSALVVSLVWVLFERTNLGLHAKAVIQNREMSASLGIATAKIDTWTFALGSGVAGLGGLALSQIGNVGPELGQLYIVDSFMVVVLGGVGKIAGTIAGAMGLGIINKLLEPVSGAVLGKIFVLIFIILFIQKRPQGIFALKGRDAGE